jgi:hypothetical protein
VLDRSDSGGNRRSAGRSTVTSPGSSPETSPTERCEPAGPRDTNRRSRSSPLAASSRSRSSIDSERAVASRASTIAKRPSGGSTTSMACQHARTSSARMGVRLRSSAHSPMPAATPWWKWRQFEQVVGDFEQTQQREPSAWDVPQCGHRHVATARQCSCSNQRSSTHRARNWIRRSVPTRFAACGHDPWQGVSGELTIRSTSEPAGTCVPAAGNWSVTIQLSSYESSAG